MGVSVQGYQCAGCWQGWKESEGCWLQVWPPSSGSEEGTDQDPYEGGMITNLGGWSFCGCVGVGVSVLLMFQFNFRDSSHGIVSGEAKFRYLYL